MNETTSTNVVSKTSPALKNKRLALGLIGFGLLLFLLMGLSVYTESLFYRWDQPVNDYFAQLYRDAPNWLKSLARYIEIVGSEGLTIATVILLIVWAIRRQFRYFWLMLVTIFGVRIVWLAILFAIGRPRPTEVRAYFDIVLPGFPSGHMMLFVAFFGTLLYLFFAQIKNRGWRLLVAATVVTLLLITGLIRLFFTVHFFTDVIAGYGLGLAWTLGALMTVDLLLKRTG